MKFAKRWGLHHVLPGLAVSTPAALAGFLFAGGLGLFGAGTTACVWFYLGRENAQAETRARNSGDSGMLAGWKPRFWIEPFDLITPSLVTGCIWGVIGATVA